jgi:hypothetical protein
VSWINCRLRKIFLLIISVFVMIMSPGLASSEICL